jgi:hypothetical protein
MWSRRRSVGVAVALGWGVLFAPPVAEAKDWPVRARGQVFWLDGSSWKPLSGARVYVMDSDVDQDDLIASGTTDAQGRFDLSGVGGDPKVPFVCDDACSKPDVYVKVELENARITVENEVGFNRYATTSVRDNTSGLLDFGGFAFGGDGANAAILFAKATEQYANFSATIGGLIPGHGGHLRILYPAYLAAGVPFTTEESIHWPGGYDQWNAVYHEFGHRIRHARDGDFSHFLADVVKYSYMQHHSYDKKTNEGFAFNEGWAEYYSTLLNPNARATFEQWTERPGGDSTEGNVAAKLLRHANQCGGIKNMWAALSSASIHSYQEFRNALARLFPGCVQPVRLLAAVSPVVSATVETGVTLDRQAAALSALPTASRLAVANSVASFQNRVATLRTLRATAHPAVLPAGNLRALALARKGEWLSSVQSTYESQLKALVPADPRNVADGSFWRSRRQGRSAFLHAVVSTRLSQIVELRQAAARALARARDPELRQYLTEVGAKHARVEAALRAALSNLSAPHVKIPTALLPRELGEPLVPFTLPTPVLPH